MARRARYISFALALALEPDPVMAEMRATIGAIVIATPHIMPANPAAATTVTGHPDPVIAFVPVAGAIIIGPVSDADREIDRVGLLRQRRVYRHNRCQKNQNFSFHIGFDHPITNLFGVLANFFCREREAGRASDQDAGLLP